MNIAFSYINRADGATCTVSSEHLSFPAINVQHRWFMKPWRSKYGAGSIWGLFRVWAGTNGKIYFKEGGGIVLTATITAGDYDALTLCAEIKTQMEVAGALTYTATYSDVTNKFTIAGSGAFILCLSSTSGSAFPMLGWTAIIDTASLASHTAPYMRIHSMEGLMFAMGSSYQLDFVAVKNHNFQATALTRLQHYNDAFITLQAQDNLTYNAGLMAKIIDRVYPYVRLRMIDIDNPDTYLEVGRVWMGPLFTPRIGFSMERSRVPQDPSVISESENGQEATIQRTKFDTWNYTFEGVDPDNKAEFETMFATVGTSKALFICEKPDEADITPYTKYIRFVSWNWEHLAGDWWKLILEIKEER